MPGWLVWLRLAVVERQLLTVGTNFDHIWDDERFPRIAASTTRMTCYNSNDVLAMENAKQICLLANLRADMVTAKSYDSDSDCDEEGVAYKETGQEFIPGGNN